MALGKTRHFSFPFPRSGNKETFSFVLPLFFHGKTETQLQCLAPEPARVSNGKLKKNKTDTLKKEKSVSKQKLEQVSYFYYDY